MTAISTQAHVCPEKKKKLGAGQIVLIIVMMLFVLICTLPFINVIAMSMSSKSAILRGAVSFWPVEFNLDAYKLIVNDNSMWHSLLYTIELTVIYTGLAMIMTILVAFPLSMRRLKGQRVIMFFIVFTMYFSGGTIPIYLNVKEFGMLDSMWSLIIPGLISTFNVIILKNFFSSLPYELVEAASIDGATDFQVLTRIFLPLSFSSLATLSLFYAVGKWNSFNDALYYITSRDLQPLQLKLYNLIKGSQSVEVAVAEGSSNDLSTSVSESIQSATIIFATLPILIVYPFVQRYFVAVLVAEDNDLNYEVEQELLGMYGITCERAANGEICVDKFHRAEPKTYDAILMDMQMPVMDGIDAAKHIRQMDSESAEIPIIAVTANAFKSDEEHCAEAGMNAHLSKPFDINKLMEVLTSLLDLEYTENENVQ